MNTRPILNVLELAQTGVPVLCPDTCAILDLLRSPTREDVRADHRQAALFLLAAMEHGDDLVGLLAEQVAHELRENQPNVEDETSKSIARLKSQMARLDAVAAVYGATGTIDLSHLDDHLSRAMATVNRWEAASCAVPQAHEIAGRAFLRVNTGRTPADKGKQSMKDCVVIETYLDAARQLRSAGHKAPIVFVSSNTKDYAVTTGSLLKPDLAAEFAALSMSYAPNLAAAKFQLGL